MSIRLMHIFQVSVTVVKSANEVLVNKLELLTKENTRVSCWQQIEKIETYYNRKICSIFSACQFAFRKKYSM